MSEAPKRIWAGTVDGIGHWWEQKDIVGHTEYVRADLLPVVKPLVWEETHNGVWRAKYRAGHFYECFNVGADRWVLYETIHGTGRQIGDIWSDLEDAIAAAQADYEARIRASLDMIDPAALVAGAYEAAADEVVAALSMPCAGFLEVQAAIRDLTSADAQAALDAAITKAVNEKLDEVVVNKHITDGCEGWCKDSGRPGVYEDCLACIQTKAILEMKEPE